MFQCPSCARTQEPRLVCLSCGAPLAAELDLFAALGLSRRLQIDIAELESAYYELGRQIHPDRFASAPQQVRDSSLKATALLTRAHRILRGPVSRGLYWLELNGRKLAENNKQVPPELAELVFEVQEQLAELREAGAEDRSETRELAIAMTAKRAELQGLMDELQAELVESFAIFDSANEPYSESLFDELKRTLSAIAYITTLLRDVDQELDKARPA
jgi:molecular chaperone HscB